MRFEEVRGGGHTGSFLGAVRRAMEGYWEGLYQPTFEVASVRELSVVLLPDDGLPTRPMRGSRGMVIKVCLRMNFLVLLRSSDVVVNRDIRYYVR